MRKLVIKDFSCIAKAELDFSRVTVLIGPQASGKSILCKLSYFFIDILQEQSNLVSDHENLDSFTKQLKIRFCEWFPPSAWGDKKFSIDFFAGEYSVQLSRKTYKGMVSEDFRVKYSSAFEQQYNETYLQVKKFLSRPKKNESDFFEIEWEIRHLCEKSLSKVLGSDYVPSQIFIPAGRSFFTSIGKAVAAFEQGKVLDPLTIRFGRIFAAYKDRRFGMNSENVEKSGIRESLNLLLGGDYVNRNDSEYVQSTDGRKIPISALSSGQQELLPLVTVLPRFISASRRNIYIEEPEAHLFPSAQSKLVEIFSNLINQTRNNVDMVLTTHSPYVLVKLNNLIKAGQLGRVQIRDRSTKVSEVIPKNFWMRPNFVKAYAIINGELKNIIDKDGFIDAEYLDDVSGEISNEFMRLLEIEVA
ncbi:AAA family ATPase [Undibacterium fentianense]|uniref:AAA family ATPase n=1 Tax=Undibacterium fentianense TaxID=2828728 RepID=A0A941E3N3_9BURK|nr:ATP-binding protein [Undibacterium fentianense]MBR7800502.1 AAA family ATPase [Undibacterium fentianense]